ncbi:hypothetical protein DL769_003124 [Monosporascus sp. CRB-8-3]|nr:hypothetical protein DL769_003124 [Monosporascus sp. CRB-8-3]
MLCDRAGCRTKAQIFFWAAETFTLPGIRGPFIYGRVSGSSQDCEDDPYITVEKGDDHEPALFTNCGGSGPANANFDTSLGTYEARFITGLRPMTGDRAARAQVLGRQEGSRQRHLVLELGPGRARYVGEPSDEMDEGWRHLIGPFMSLTLAEAAAVQGGQEFHGEYPATTTFQHSLRCLNFLRQAVYGAARYYPDVVLERGADMTSLLMRWDDSAGMLLTDFEREHTCHNYQTLLRWAENRHADGVVRMGGFQIGTPRS